MLYRVYSLSSHRVDSRVARVAGCWLSSDALEELLENLEVSRAHVLSRIAVGILSLVLRTVISRGRGEYGAVEKTLKGIFTICTLLGFPCGRGVVMDHLHWRQNAFATAEVLFPPCLQPAVSAFSFAMKLTWLLHR